MRFVDTFLFSEPYEADVLWVKLNVEDHLFDEWVVVENSHTHQGQYKGHHLNELIFGDERFAQFVPRLHVIESDIKPGFRVGGRKVFDDDAMQIEGAQRDAALSYLLDKYADQDYVLISDVDECLDTEERKRRLLLSKVATGKDIILVPRIRYWFDYDNRWLVRRCVPLVSIRQLRRDGRVSYYSKMMGTPVIWKHEMVFEYSHCFSRDGIMRKFETFIHTGFDREEIDIALRLNCRPESKYRTRRMDWTYKDWFVKRRLNSRNSPAFVREHLAELKTNVVSPDYRYNRMEAYPEYFPKSPVTRARKWVVLFGSMYSDFLEQHSRAYSALIKKWKSLGWVRGQIEN